MKFRTSAAIAVMALSSHAGLAQHLATLDELPLDPDSFYNGADLAGGFVSEGVVFLNDFDTTFGSWGGFSYSNLNDPSTPGFFNQYAVSSGVDVSGSGNYAVGYDGAYGPEADIVRLPVASQVRGLFLNNTTYAALSMLDGDPFAKQFGGETGDDPDVFLITLTGKDLEGNVLGSVEHYLADYRFDDNGLDYVQTDWAWVDLTGLGPDVATLHFALSSSDNGVFGMNTPSYFALDDLAFVTREEWERKSDVAVTGLELDTVARGRRGAKILTAEVSLRNLGGRSIGGWVITLTTHPDLRRPIVRWRRFRPLGPGQESTVRLNLLRLWNRMPRGDYTVRAIAVPWGPRGEITLKNNEATETFTW